MSTHRIWVCLAARIRFKRIYSELDMKFSSGWFNGFCVRWEDTLRVATNRAQETPLLHIVISWCASADETLYHEAHKWHTTVGPFDALPLPFGYLCGRRMPERETRLSRANLQWLG